jgi:cytochrome c556
MKFSAKLICGAGLALAIFTTLSAQELRPDRAMRYRQGVMYAMNIHLGVLSRMVKGEIPYNKDTAVRSATFINDLSKMPWDGFVPVSYEGGKTKAKAEIWKDKASFDKLAEAMQAEIPKLVAAAQSGDVAKLKPAVSAVGEACKNCHDKFENE